MHFYKCDGTKMSAINNREQHRFLFSCTLSNYCLFTKASRSFNVSLLHDICSGCIVELTDLDLLCTVRTLHNSSL